jgi:uncharacterized protein (TIGR02231 family)
MPTLETDIAAVNVYTDQARITRRGKTALQPGLQTLVLPNLPAALVDESVRASGRGAGAQIAGVEVKTVFAAEAPGDSAAALEKALHDLEDQRRALQDEDAGQLARLDYLKTLREQGGAAMGRALSGRRAALGDVTQLGDYLLREWRTVSAARQDIARQLRDLERAISAARQRIDQHGHARLERREIHVAVEAAAAAAFELDVMYAVRGASWTPLYDVRLGEDETVTLTYLAHISQRTGEDWPEVELSLSTARPATTATLPELDPWYIGPRLAFPTASAARGGGSLSTLVGGLMQPAPEPVPAPQADIRRDHALMPVEPMQAAVESSGANVTYRVLKPIALPSDGAPHRTTVAVATLKAKLDYLTVPKLAEEAYLRASITNDSPYILLPGEASIFHGLEFVGKTALETVVPGEEFEAQLGVDERIRVERELVKRDVSRNRIGSTRRTGFTYRITLRNLLAKPAKITVLDQLPLPRHESVKVRLENSAPAVTEQSDLNILTWELELAAGAQQEITFSFTVEHPRDLDVPLGIS